MNFDTRLDTHSIKRIGRIELNFLWSQFSIASEYTHLLCKGKYHCGAVVVPQLAEQSTPTPNISGSNPAIGNDSNSDLNWNDFTFTIHLSIRPIAILSPTYLPTYLPTYPSTYLPTHLPTYLPIYLPTYPSTYLPIYLPIYLLGLVSLDN